MSRLLRWVSLLLVFALATTTTSAQEEESPDSHALVVTALENFADLSSFHFMYERRNINDYVIENGQNFPYLALSIVEGDALANGDFFMSVSFKFADSLEHLNAAMPLHYEHISLNGEAAYKFLIEDTFYEDVLPFGSGWQSEEIVTAELEGMSYQGIIENLNQLTPPKDFSEAPSHIESVAEDISEVIDGTNMRVFDVEVNGWDALLAGLPARGRERMENYLKNAEFRAASEINMDYRLWINEDEQQIYRAIVHTESYLPYVSTGFGDEFPYDWTLDSVLEVNISRHNQSLVIEPVELMLCTNPAMPQCL